MSLTTLNGYLTIFAIAAATIAADTSVPHWLKVIAIVVGAFAGAMRVASGHAQGDASPNPKS